MRITIDTDDKGKVNIDTGDKGNDKSGLFESTADVPVIDAGPAPLQEVERQQNVTGAGEGGIVSASESPEDRQSKLPLNPLRAGAAAAYQNPANLRKMAAAPEGTAAARDQLITTIDGGSAQMPREKKSSDAPTSERQPAKGAKRGKRR